MSANLPNSHFDWIKPYDGCLGVGCHSLGDDGTLGFIMRDQIAARAYRIVHVTDLHKPQPVMIKHPGFTLDPVKYAECPPEANHGFLLTENDVTYIRLDGSLVRRSSYQAKAGETFLDMKTAGADPKRAAVVLSHNRKTASFSLTLLEATDTIFLTWTKSWADPAQALAVSSDGGYIAVGLRNGGVVVMNRNRKVVWFNQGNGRNPIVALAVDKAGNVISVDGSGETKCLNAIDGSIKWRTFTHTGANLIDYAATGHYLTVSPDGDLSLSIINTYDDTDQSTASLIALLNAETGEVIWDDYVDSPTTGVAISPSGKEAIIACSNFNLVKLTLKHGETSLKLAEHRFTRAAAPELLSEANEALLNREFAKSVTILQKLFTIEPALFGSGALYEDASWHYREHIMETSKSVTSESLQIVQEALKVLPHDEKLTIRRNALARLLCEQYADAADELANSGQYEQAIEKSMAGLEFDGTQTDTRNRLRQIIDAYILDLLKQSDAAFSQDNFDLAIELLEKIILLHPGELAIINRIEQAKGLRAFTTGMTYYISRRYKEAIFWFRKTLDLSPSNEEAERFLAFAINFSHAPIANMDEEPDTKVAITQPITRGDG